MKDLTTKNSITKNKLQTKELILFAILGALTFALKFVMAPLPNIEPVTLLIMVYAGVFSYKALYPTLVYIICELLVYGFGIWSIGYCYIWFILGLIACVILPKVKGYIPPAIIGCLFGLLFGALYIPVYVITTGVEGAIAWWIAGISYDVIHGVANAIIALFLYQPLVKALKKLYERF